MMEQWKDIVGYEGLYQVSSMGRYRKVGSAKECNKLAEHHKGYFKAQLRKDGKQKAFFIHRLVAIAFIPNPENKETVNHKDGNKSNNCVSNLEWMTNSENMKHAYDTGIRNNDKVSRAKWKPIAQYSKDGTFIRNYKSIKEAVELNEGFRQGGISSCLTGSYKTSHGYVWKFI